VALTETDTAPRRHALQAALDGCDRATRLVEQLLTLSRLEAHTAPSARPVDVVAVVRQVMAGMAPRAVGKGQTIELDATERCVMAADETLLSVLVRNLVDNAVRYSPPGARVRVSVQRQGDRVVLRVEDSGPGLAPDVQQRLGQRFFRPPGQAETGSGLGWSIVRRIAEVLRLDIDTRPSKALGGLSVQVSARAASEPHGGATSL
jgi:two-component system sensor histidine kinase QseC